MLSKKKKFKKRPKKASKAVKSALGPDCNSKKDVKLTKDMSEWVNLGAPPAIIRGLSELGFNAPTPIQRAALPPAINGADIIGAAETGSGKTLAFAIPILQYILKHHPPSDSVTRSSVKKKNKKKQKLSIPTISVLVSKNVNDLPKGLNSLKVIDLNEVSHSIVEDQPDTGSETGNDPAIQEVDDDVGSDVESKSEEQLVFEIDSETENKSLTESEDQGHSSESDDGSQPGVVLSQKRKRKLSAYRQLRAASRAKKRRGMVGVKNHIPDKEFQLMLDGELDVWSSQQSINEPAISSKTGSSHTVTESDGILTESGDVVTGSSDVVTGSCDVVSKSGCGMVALILTPTRELALQVHAHIKSVARYTKIKVCTVVGGMATEKQERLLRQRPHIVVATPGRLWKLMSEGDAHLCNHGNLQFMVLDEADRMIEYGHYKELGNILDRLNGGRVKDQTKAKSQQKVKGQHEVKGHDRQTLVFSATLAISRRSTEKKKRKKMTSSQETIDNLISRVGLKEDAKVIDLTGSKITVKTLTETKIICTTEEKDMFLYYFLLHHPGRSIVFVNSIDCLHRLRAILELLELKPHPLHAHMQQRQRLKNLDRFTTCSSGVLLASDVAARGLDLPAVEYIVHYQVPRNSEVYVHRSGRTARGQREGLSVMLVGPDDIKAYRNICRTLSRDDVPNFPVDHTHLRPLRGRVSLARQVHMIEYRRDKARRADKWMSTTAESLGMELEDDLLSGKEWTKKEENKLEELRGQLRDMLQSKVLPSGASAQFPTRDHTLFSHLQGQSSSGIILEQERAQLLAQGHRTIKT